MTDIVERLRDCSKYGAYQQGQPGRLMGEAADEIERLRELSEMKTVEIERLERLRAALQQLASMAESGARAYDDNELRDLLIEIDNHGRRALEPQP